MVREYVLVQMIFVNFVHNKYINIHPNVIKNYMVLIKLHKNYINLIKMSHMIGSVADN